MINKHKHHQTSTYYQY